MSKQKQAPKKETTPKEQSKSDMVTAPIMKGLVSGGKKTVGKFRS